MTGAICSPLFARSDDASRVPHLPGYAAVPVRYGLINRMLLVAMVNGHKATFMVDTGAARSLLDAGFARTFGVKPLGEDSPYGARTDVNGTSAQIGFINHLTAGEMDFGGGPIVINGEYGKERASSFYHRDEIAGVLGADILTRYKAVINCRQRVIFFKLNDSGRLQLARFCASQHFARVPLREEVTRSFTVPASLRGHPIRLIVDTGAPLTLLDQDLVKSLGIPLKPTRVVGAFINSTASAVSLGQFSDLQIGDFRLARQKLTVSELPEFVVELGKVNSAGVLGIDSLVSNRAIIDFEGMNLFLK